MIFDADYWRTLKDYLTSGDLIGQLALNCIGGIVGGIVVIRWFRRGPRRTARVLLRMPGRRYLLWLSETLEFTQHGEMTGAALGSVQDLIDRIPVEAPKVAAVAPSGGEWRNRVTEIESVITRLPGDACDPELLQICYAVRIATEEWDGWLRTRHAAGTDRSSPQYTLAANRLRAALTELYKRMPDPWSNPPDYSAPRLSRLQSLKARVRLLATTAGARK